MGLLDLAFVRRTRRNHAIEHATVHILSARRPGVALAGRSDGAGFHLYGRVDTEDVRQAVEEALLRLGTEPSLALHPHCGTNFLVGGMLAAGAALVALLTTGADPRARRPLAILPRLLLAGTLAAVASQPAGPWVQRRVTTSPDVAGARIDRIRVWTRGRHRLHRVEIAEGIGTPIRP